MSEPAHLSEPSWRLTRWLVDPGYEITPANRLSLLKGLYGSTPIFVGGVVNTLLVSIIAFSRAPTAGFLVWVILELALAAARFPLLVHGRTAIETGKNARSDIYIVLAVIWAASVGYGSFVSIASGDWVLAMLACFSAAGMVGGICMRNFTAPRLVGIMAILSLGPSSAAALFFGEPALLLITLQVPIYVLTMSRAAFQLNRMLVARMETEQALQASQAVNRSILDSTPDCINMLDENGRIIFVNRLGPAALELDASDTLLGAKWVDTLPAEAVDDAKAALAKAAPGDPAHLVVRQRTGRDNLKWYDIVVASLGDAESGAVVIARDISDQKASEEQAFWMARHDSLTGLPNRLILQQRLDELVQQESNPFALILLDVDNFKSINDSFGHDAGDAVLCKFAERIRGAVRPEDLVARLGGDEFAVIIMGASTETKVTAVGKKISAALRRPLIHSERFVETNASLGASLFPRDGTSRSQLMKDADTALYVAKAAGRGNLKIFRTSMRNEIQSRNSMLSLARDALDADRVEPFYQPKVDLRSGSVVGFEALLRWSHGPTSQRQLPGRIAAAFENPALAHRISERMIERALADVRQWLDDGTEFGHVAINASAPDLRRVDFAESFLEHLHRADVPPQCIQLEITESVFIGRGAECTEQALRLLSSNGVRIALDDFGTGFASLTHLSQFPVHVLKIDRAFVRNMGTSLESEAIVRAVISLGMEIVAEGIETVAQEAQLRALGCDTGQGFFYAPATCMRDVPRLIRTSRDPASFVG